MGPRVPGVSRSGVFVSRVGPWAYVFRMVCLLVGTVFLMATAVILWRDGWSSLLYVGFLDLYAVVSIMIGLGFSAPSSLTLVQRNEPWQVEIRRRFRSDKTFPLASLSGLLEVRDRAVSSGTTVGYSTGTPSWELTFPGESWIITLEDHMGFLEYLANVCESSNHRLTQNLKHQLGLIRRGVPL
ncbi:unnamed protein product [Symbiodinium necroappetens]|uniref:Uncharacterized protein n=1 Tax=Symbiodinium necroappetens TaxID=1628268 RepID=A0A813BTD7_9DINO|nr:unnamed protein product [Symbiodinium necroappetens]